MLKRCKTPKKLKNFRHVTSVFYWTKVGKYWRKRNEFEYVEFQNAGNDE